MNVLINARMNAYTITFIRQNTVRSVHVHQNMNEFMKNRSLNTFRHNTGQKANRLVASHSLRDRDIEVGNQSLSEVSHFCKICYSM